LQYIGYAAVVLSSLVVVVPEATELASSSVFAQAKLGNFLNRAAWYLGWL
jgi:hypothetical protein